MNNKARKPKAKADFGAAAPAIRKELTAALSDAGVKNYVVDIWSDIRFDMINESVSKYFGRWLSPTDTSGIIINSVYQRLQMNSAADEQSRLDSHLTASQIVEIADEIIAFLKTIPRSYDILFPLPNVKEMIDFTLAGPVSFESRAGAAQTQGPRQYTLADMANFNEPEKIAVPATTMPKQMYLKIRASGFAETSRTVSAMHDAMAVLKRTIQVGIAKEVFNRKRTQGGILASALRGHDTQTILEALVFDLTDAETTPKVVKLGLGMSSYLNEISVRELLPLAAATTPAMTIEQFLVVRLSQSVEVLTSHFAAADSAALRSAFEWAFDAAADDEVIGRCIKTCIALEAALGEDSDERGITERMADRVAYVIGKAPSERKTFREYMREFYKLRSNLVHGKQATLNPSDHAVEFRGRSILGMVLTRELDEIEKWWRRKRDSLTAMSSGLPPT